MLENIVEGEVLAKNPTAEDVNNLLLRKIYNGINGTENAEEILTWTEALSKYNTSIRNNTIFKEEDEEMVRSKATQAAVADILKGKNV